ncbi:MAG: hypothetical protein MUE51_12495 [Thermoleophilia bacterium]|jgi:hypothetical protein|nr:hypothetical protein [Thermoleophilia bacterium]
MGVVIDLAVARAAGLDPRGGVEVVPRPRARRRPGRRVRWRPLDPDAVLAALDADPGGLVLARSPAADPGAACLVGLARLLGHEVVLLPPGEAAAGWVAALGAEWAAGRAPAEVVRRAQAAAGVPGAPCAVARREWGEEGVLVPALRPEALGRWCALAWRRCGWCARGGSLAGAPCGRCGARPPGPGAAA